MAKSLNIVNDSMITNILKLLVKVLYPTTCELGSPYCAREEGIRD